MFNVLLETTAITSSGNIAVTTTTIEFRTPSQRETFIEKLETFEQGNSFAIYRKAIEL